MSAVRRVALMAALVLAARLAAAQEPQLRAEVDATRVGLEDQVQLTVTAEGGGLSPDIGPPPLRGLRVAGGPSVSTSISFVNGSMSQSQSYTWVLQPTAVGRGEVGALRVRLGNAERTTAPIAVEVVPGSIHPAARPVDPLGGDPFGDLMGRMGRPQPPTDPKVYVEAAPSRTRLHVGEPLLLTFYVYTQTVVTDLQFTTPPQLGGFWSEDLERPNPPPGGEPVTVNGEVYHRFPVLQKLLFPTRAGTLPIPATTLRVGLERQSFFETGGTVERSTKPLTIVADPIPDEPGFTGAVGHFTARAELDRVSVGLGEAATLRFTVEGSGNLKWIDRGPDVVLSGARAYAPQVKSDLKAAPDGIHGSKTWETVIVPETAGTLQVPALAFSYFDPALGRIERAETAPMTLQVEPGRPGAAVPAPGPGLQAPGGLSLRDSLDEPTLSVPALSGELVLAALGAVLALHGLLWAGFALADRRRAVAGRTATRGSVHAAVHDLERAARPGVTKEAAAALIEKALVEVFGFVDDGSTPSNEREAEARRLLQEVQFIRYAPQLGDYSEKIRDVAARAATLVRRSA